VAAPEEGPLRTSTVALVPDLPLSACRFPIDTLIVAGGTGTRRAEEGDKLVEWLKGAAKRSRRVTSVCTGAFLLAKAGLLDGRRATTHWASCADLAERYPEVTVEPDPIFVRDGNVATSAGVTAGMDLALALVEEDLGRETALEAARWLVLFLKRPGGQAQFSAQLAAQTADRAPLRELQAWIPDHLDEDLSVPALARRTAMSERNFARAFRRETGMTPAAYVEAARVESARIALEAGDLPVETVARHAGFGTVETMRRAFRRRVGVSPVDYRSRFRRQAA
jgi:transcriptional regulator GlxA family with amidase domain